MTYKSNEEWKARLKELRQHPFVVQWIKDYQRTISWKKYEDCRNCGYPHAAGFICGMGSTFGQLRIGQHLYYVDQSNVDYFVAFREKPRKGFHWRNDIYFERLPGCVEVTYFDQYNNSPQERKWRIPHSEWASIVCSVSSLGETAERWETAQDFHGRSSPVSETDD
jgi:hypothetical protein